MIGWTRWLGVAGIGLGVVLWTRSGASSSTAHAAPAGESLVDDIALAPHDFGRLVGTVVRTVELTHTNGSGVPWTLRKTWSECGCVDLVSASERVEPGAEARFELRIDTTGQPAGSFARHAFALYDPGPRRIALTATADVAPRPYPVPHVIDVELTEEQDEWREAGWVESPFPSARLALVGTKGDVEVEVGAPESTESGTRLPFVCSGVLVPPTPRRDVALTFVVWGDPDLPDGEELVLRGTIRRVPPIAVSPRVLVLEGDEDLLRGRVWLRRSDGTWPADVELHVPDGTPCAAVYDARDGSIAIEAHVRSENADAFRLRARMSSGDAVDLPVRLVPGRRPR